MPAIKTLAALGAALREPYAWPGGYPIYFIMSDGDTMSFKSAWENRRQLFQAMRDNDNSGWRPIARDVNYEDELYCCHSGERIEAAYGDQLPTEE